MAFSSGGTVNKIELIGRLGQDPELRYTQSGKAVVNVSIATNEKSGDKEVTSWHKVTFWEKKADVIAKYCHKGSKIRITGTLGYREYTDKSGVSKISAEIDGDELTLLDSKQDGGGQQQQQDGGRQSQGQSRRQAPPQNEEIPYGDDEDIPF